MAFVYILLIPRFLSSIVIRLRSLGLIIFDFLMKLLIKPLERLHCVVQFIGPYIQSLFGIKFGNHYSLVNILDDHIFIYFPY